MFRTVLIAAAIAVAAPALAAAPAAKHLCGWVENPTPANWWLTDKNGQWIINTQGGAQATGDLPDFQKGKLYWVATQPNGYGYGCGCITATVDGKTKQVSKIFKAEVLKLQVCRKDQTLVEPK